MLVPGLGRLLGIVLPLLDPSDRPGSYHPFPANMVHDACVFCQHIWFSFPFLCVFSVADVVFCRLRMRDDWNLSKKGSILLINSKSSGDPAFQLVNLPDKIQMGRVRHGEASLLQQPYLTCALALVGDASCPSPCCFCNASVLLFFLPLSFLIFPWSCVPSFPVQMLTASRTSLRD